MIKVICFDLDGVYFLKGKENFIASLGKLGVSRESVQEVFLKSDRMNKEYKTGLIGDQEFWQWAIDSWRLPMTIGGVIDLLISGYEINRSAAQLAKELRIKGYKTAICSNNFPARINGLEKRFKFLENFDTAVFSYEVGVLKPDEKIFQELIKHCGCLPEEIAYSDDDESKLAGARQLGIKTFVYRGFSQFRQELKKLGVKG